MKEFLHDCRWSILALSLFFVVSRIWLSLQGIEPNSEILLRHWQHADLNLLDTHYWKTLWFQHSQPPLWNGLIGLFVNLLGNDAEIVTRALHFCFMGLSYVGMLLMFSIFRDIGLGAIGAFVAALLFSISPAVLYYENYIFYPHLTWFFVTIFLFGLNHIRSDKSFWPFGLCLASLAALSWTWAIFHPAFVLVTGAGVLWIGRHLFQRGLVLLLVLSTLFSALPVVKNAVVFSIPSSSSWFGMNLAQTAVVFGSDKSKYCDFYLVHQSIWREDAPPPTGLFPSLSDPLKSSSHANLNHIDIASRASECLDIALDAIVQRPAGWLADRMDQLVASHKIPSFSYMFQPVGWDRLDPEGLIAANIPASGNLLLCLFAVLLFWCTYQAIAGPKRRLFAVILFFILYFTLVSHLANGHEQHRMRYSLLPLYWYLLILLISSVSKTIHGRILLARTASGI